jgi:putative transposase
MSKAKRIIPVNAAMHVVNRGNNKQDIFNNDADKLRYYALLLELKQENRITIFHYCFMDNHPHLIVWLNEESRLSKFMKQLSLSYYDYYKKSYGHSGHLWQGRFKSNVIDTDSYLLQCGKYIELNPVRAKMIALPQEYLFSSYNFYAYGKPDSLLTPSPAYLALSDSVQARMKQYIDFVVDSNVINSDKLRKQRFIGNRDFIDRSEKLYGVKNEPSERGRPVRP